MRTLDALIESHLNDGRYTVFQICELIGPSATYRFTDAPLPIVWNGFTWSNVWFVTGEYVIDNDGEINMTITFEDVSQTIRALAFANDLNRFEIKVYEIWADTTNTVYGQDLTIHGVCDGVKCSGDEELDPTAVLQIRGVFSTSAMAMGPRQDYTRNCRYDQFKGAQCKYSGVVTFCDRLYATCSSLGNTINFGGFRWVLSPDQTVTWGGTTSTVGSRPGQDEYYSPYDTGGWFTGGASAPNPDPTKRRAVGRH